MLKLVPLFILVGILTSCNQRPKRNSAFYLNLGGEPTSFNPISHSDSYKSQVKSYMFESLLSVDVDTYEWKPQLAESWTVSDDKMKYTFKLREGVKWHDGKELTAEDVKFSFDVLFQDKFNTVPIRPYYTGIKEVKVIDKYNVEIIAKDKFWQNFERAAGLTIYPKHFYEQDKKKSFFNKVVIGSGPYKLGLYSRGNRIVLERNKDWWGYKVPNQKEWNFEKIVLRFVSDNTVALEMLKKGSLDFVGMRPDAYVKKAVGPKWGKEYHKVLTKNNTPKGYNFIGWNLKHPILKDKRVRKALYHLVNRPLMIEKFEYGYSVPAVGPIYPQSPYHNKNLKPVEYDPKLALKILREAGWSDTDGDNILDKVIDGKKTKFSITILEPAEAFMKYLTVFKEDAKKAGVELNLKLIEWNSFIKLLEERKFDACRLAWSSVIDWNPIQIWHTDSYKGGSNFIGFSNKEADELMTKAKFIHDRAERIKVLNKVEEIIVNEHPYVWFTYKESTMYGYTNRMLREKETYKYGIGTSFWKFTSEMRKDI
jgi:peptide/nickel transport system substrate-binding protein/microcin C transport system substrate-binding protein